MGQGGQSFSDVERSGKLEIKEDPTFAPFLAGSFDASSFASNALSNTQTTPTAQIDRLQQGIALLDHHLRRVVLEHREGLLRHAAKAEDIDGSVQRIGLSIKSLQSIVARIRADVVAPCQDAELKTVQLRNLQATVDLLRHITHRMKVVQRLRAEMESIQRKEGDILEVGKAARLLSDVAALEAEADLTGIDVLREDDEFVREARPKVRRMIDDTLRRGLETLSQADVGSALQGLFNLGELRSAVMAYVEGEAGTLQRELSSCLDPRKLSAAVSKGNVPGGEGGGVRGMVGAFQGAPTTRLQDALWQRLESQFESLWRSSIAVWHLQRVLFKKKDPLSHKPLVQAVISTKERYPGERHLSLEEQGIIVEREISVDTLDGVDESLDKTAYPLNLFWKTVTDAFSECFGSLSGAQRSSVVLDILTLSYPRLAALIDKTCNRIAADGMAKLAPLAIDIHQADLLRSSFKNIEDAWIEGMQSRFSGAATAAFQGGQRPLPTAAELQSFVAKLSEELKSSSSSGDRVSAMTAMIAGSALQTVAERAELMSSGTSDARVLQGACTPAQNRNISICNAMHEIHRSIGALCTRLPSPAVAALAGPLQALQGTAFDVISPLFRAMVEDCQDRILKVHGLNFNADENAETRIVDTSPFMRDLIRQLAFFRREYFARFNPPIATGMASETMSVPRALAERMAARVIVFFVRQVSLIRELSRPGKLQLAKDGMELEAAVAQHFGSAMKLQEPVSRLRMLKKLLFLETAEIPASIEVSDANKIVIVHHLFSRVPRGLLQSPLDRAKLTPIQYSLWMDEHSNEDVAKQVQLALQSQENNLRETQEGKDVVEILTRILNT